MSARHALLDLTPLRHSQPFRRLWTGSQLSGFGAQIAIVAVLFQVWETTHNAFWVGAIGIAQAIPMIVMGLLGGPAADVLDRRRIALWSTAGQSLAAFTLAAQLVFGAYPLPLLLGILAIQTSFSAFGAPARKTFIVRLLPRHLVAGGIALQMIGFQATMLIGPALGGVLIGATSVGVCYLINAVALMVSTWTVWALPPMPRLSSDERSGAETVPEAIPAIDAGVVSGAGAAGATSSPGATAYPRGRVGRLLRRTRTAFGMLADGVTYVARDEVLRGSFLLDLVATLLAFPFALFPMVNQDLFGGDPRTLGLFMSAVAVGGVTAGVASGLVTRSAHLGRVQLLAVGVWGVALLAFGLAALAGLAWVALVTLIFAGAADTTSVTSRAAMVQLATPDQRLGRVSAVEHIIGVAGPDLGNARAGAVAGFTTPAISAIVGSAACLVISAWVAVTHRGVGAFTLQGRLSEHGDVAHGSPQFASGAQHHPQGVVDGAPRGQDHVVTDNPPGHGSVG